MVWAHLWEPAPTCLPSYAGRASLVLRLRLLHGSWRKQKNALIAQKNSSIVKPKWYQILKHVTSPQKRDQSAPPNLSAYKKLNFEGNSQRRNSRFSRQDAPFMDLDLLTVLALT